MKDMSIYRFRYGRTPTGNVECKPLSTELTSNSDTKVKNDTAFNPIIHDAEYKANWDEKVRKKTQSNRELWGKQKSGEYKKSRL